MHLMYVDESGDTGLPSAGSPTTLFCLSGVVVHELAWQDTIRQLLQFRRWLRRQHGIPQEAELHTAEMINKVYAAEWRQRVLSKTETRLVYRGFKKGSLRYGDREIADVSAKNGAALASRPGGSYYPNNSRFRSIRRIHRKQPGVKLTPIFQREQNMSKISQICAKTERGRQNGSMSAYRTVETPSGSYKSTKTPFFAAFSMFVYVSASVRLSDTAGIPSQFRGPKVPKIAALSLFASRTGHF